MKNLLFTCSFLFFSIWLGGQDMIILTNGDIIESKVLEINLNEIKYKRFNHLDGPTITIAQNDVFLIKYENGMKEVITEIGQEKKIESQPIQAQQSITPQRATQQNTYENLSPEKKQSNTPKYRVAKKFERTDSYSLYGGLSIPMGVDLLGNYFSNYMNTGGHLGLERTTMLSPHFGLVGQGLLSYNSFDLGESLSAGVVNLYGLTGGRGSFVLNDTEVYALLMIGANWSILTGDFSDFSDGLHWSIGTGTGVIIQDHIEIGLRYNHSFGSDFSALSLSAGLRF